jgi:hypothetical protein
MLDPQDALNRDFSEKTQSEPGDSWESGPSVGADEKSPSLAIEPSGSKRSPNRRATGPRTDVGKRKASGNARKHAIFSKVVVLPGESRANYERMLAELRQAFQPEGAAEDLLVEKIATIMWRYRRLLLAEAAEIRKNTEFFEWDQRNPSPAESEESEESEEFELAPMWSSTVPLIQEMNNPDVLKSCLRLLSDLGELLEKEGFDTERDESLLETIYGPRNIRLPRQDLFDTYRTWRYTSLASKEEREREGYATPEQCQNNMIRAIEAEIRRLKRYQKERASVEAARTQLAVLSRKVPDPSVLDRLLRYEASLERAFDRALSQLERLQRIRRGQSVPPPINVNISGMSS